MTAITPGHSILVVDDDPDIALGLQDLLDHDGYQVNVAGTCAEALTQAHEHQYNAVLLDLGLPDHDGLTLAGWLRADMAFKSLPIIAFTAWPPDTAKQMAESYGCNGFIAKPIEKVQDFISKIDSYLAR